MIDDYYVWSCLGLSERENAEYLLEFGIECYDDYNKFRMIEECSCSRPELRVIGEKGYRPYMKICDTCGCGWKEE